MRKYERFHGRTSDTGNRRCEQPGCTESGEFRAPKKRQEGGWHWFCLEHVRAYNAGWDFCAGMNAAEIDRMARSAYTWERQTRPLNGRGQRWDFGLDDDLDLFADAPGFGGRFTDAGRPGHDRRRLDSADVDALGTLGLDAEASAQDIRDSYKRLVRRFHPDANGGDRSQEGRLRAVIAAYKHLMRERAAAG